MKKIIAVCLISILATSYASQGITRIKPEERDRSGKFDGNWIASAHIKRNAPVYDGTTSGMLRLTCDKYEFSSSLNINDGRITIRGLLKSDGYIKEDGTLYVNGKIDKVDIDRRLIFSGQLSGNKGEGKVVITYDHPTKGCKGTVNFIMANKAPVKSPDTKKEQPVPGTDISGTYVSDIRGGANLNFSDRKLKITFKQSGTDIVGTVNNKTLITGTRKGDTITFKFFGGKNVIITGVWKINPDGTKLEGTWSTWSGNSRDGIWNLTKIEGTVTLLKSSETYTTDEIEKMAPVKSPDTIGESDSEKGVSVYDYYGEAEEEVNTKSYDKNLWARALVEAEGDQQKRVARYIELRANQLYSENVSSISKSNLNEQPVPGTDISGTYVSDIRGGPPWLFRGRSPKITFEQSGNNIIGTNVSQKGREIIGTRKGDTIKFKYGRNMTGVWKINSDGTKLEGKWEFSGNTDSSSGTWNLTIIE